MPTCAALFTISLGFLMLVPLTGCEPATKTSTVVASGTKTAGNTQTASHTPTGFADLGLDLDGFDQVTSGTQLDLPADLGMHPNFRIEWWYVTANLTDANHRQWGIQWTLFRQALLPENAATPNPEQGWQTPQLWLGHAAITNSTRHWQGETYARGGMAQAGVTAAPFNAWIDQWSLTSLSALVPAEKENKADSEFSPLQLSSPLQLFSPLQLSASTDDFRYQLTLSTDKDFVLQGNAGYSQKSSQAQASYYISQPFFKVTGELQIEGETITVQGDGWMDKEWSSQPLAANQTGWDWFSLHLDSGDKLMLFGLRSDKKPPFYSGSWISAAGVVTPLAAEQIQLTPIKHTLINGRSLPTQWHITLAHQEVDIKLKPLNPNAWMDTSIPYWEGPVSFAGSHTGRGYLEMTGY